MIQNVRLREQFMTAYYDMLMEYMRIYKATIITGQQPPSLPQFVIDSEIWTEVFDTTPPDVEMFRPLLFQLPPIVRRCDIGSGVLNFASKHAISVDDGKGKGPRVRFRIQRMICYPSLYLLEYLERNPRMRVLVRKKFDTAA